jgi:hypothetical protein
MTYSIFVPIRVMDSRRCCAIVLSTGCR